MSSTGRIDYSVRQNKSIERSIVFDGLRVIYSVPELTGLPVYIGLGSVWFTDFHLAHRLLGVVDMISIESDPITAARAEFNRPYRTVKVIPRDSLEVIADLLTEDALSVRPWIVWLDFDQALDEDRLIQIDDLVRFAPEDSTILATFSATRGQYGKPAQRVAMLQGLLGSSLSDAATADVVADEMGLSDILARSLENRMVSLALGTGRPGAIPAFRLVYKDGTPMVTVGVYLPSSTQLDRTRRAMDDPSWCGIVERPITTPPLTAREVNAMRALLPSTSSLSRADIQRVGFDLDDDQLDAFTTHYTRYPAFAQLAL